MSAFFQKVYLFFSSRANVYNQGASSFLIKINHLFPYHLLANHSLNHHLVATSTVK